MSAVDRRCVSLYICYWSLNDPLCQSQTLPYLRALAAEGYPLCLLTCERPPHASTGPDAAAAARDLAAQGVHWVGVRYREQTSAARATSDWVRLFAAGVAAVVRHRPRIVHTRTSPPAAVGVVLSAAPGLSFLYDADSELSEEYVDGGYMRRGGIRHRLLAGIEAISRRRADAIVVLTERLRADFVDRGVRAPMTVIPCCIDADRFRFDAATRAARRRELNASADKVLVYVGKTGPRYLVDETMLFAKAVANAVGTVRLLVLTPEAPDAFEAVARRCGFDASLLSVRRVAPSDVPGWLCAADAGMALIREAFSEQGSSPIKISEYLAAGLPVVTTPSIGDVSAAIDRASLGVVVDRSERARAAAVTRLCALWSAADDTRRRCAEWALSSLDLRAVAVPRYRQVYDRLLASRTAGTAVPMTRGSEGV